jgi:hypothetical protein
MPDSMVDLIRLGMDWPRATMPPDSTLLVTRELLRSWDASKPIAVHYEWSVCTLSPSDRLFTDDQGVLSKPPGPITRPPLHLPSQD